MRWVAGAPALALCCLAACGEDEASFGEPGPTTGAGGATGQGGDAGAPSTGGEAGGGASPSGSGGGAGQGGAGGGAGGCTPGQVEACYTGPPGTAGVGACKQGTRICGADGSFGPCQREVTPALETCLTPVDDDCDGQTNEAGEGCVCKPNASTYCYSGPPATENVGPCVAGLKTCNSDGTDWGPCVGEVVPATEDCSTPADEDCDGKTPLCLAEWAAKFGDAQSQALNAVAVDAAGNIVIAGELFGSADFGGGPLTSAGINDAFVTKLGPTGTHVWSKRFGDAGLQAALGVAVDAAGDVVVTGYFTGTINCGAGNLTTAGGADIFACKLAAADGAQLWGQRFGNSADDQIGASVAFDAAGNVLLAGWFQGQVTFGANPTLITAGLQDVFVAKLGPTGTAIWSKRFGNNLSQRARGVAVGASDAVLFVGEMAGTVNFGGASLASAGETDAFAVQLDAAGVHQWSVAWGDAAAQIARAVAAVPGGGALVVGEMEGTVDFGGGGLTSAGGFDAFVVEVDTAGAHKWSDAFGGASDDAALAVARDAAGNRILAGYFQNKIDFGTGALVGKGGRDAFVAKLDPMGGGYWARSFGDGAFFQQLRAAAVAPGGSIVVGGDFAGSIDVGGIALTSAGQTDALVVKYPP
jgi:hypothetical protein